MKFKTTQSIHVNKEGFLELLLFKARIIKKWDRDIRAANRVVYRRGHHDNSVFLGPLH